MFVFEEVTVFQASRRVERLLLDEDSEFQMLAQGPLVPLDRALDTLDKKILPNYSKPTRQPVEVHIEISCLKAAAASAKIITSIRNHLRTRPWFCSQPAAFIVMYGKSYSTTRPYFVLGLAMCSMSPVRPIDDEADPTFC